MWWDSGTYHISMSNIGKWQKNSTYRDMIECVQNCTWTYVRKWGKIRQRTEVWLCTRISRKEEEEETTTTTTTKTTTTTTETTTTTTAVVSHTTKTTTTTTTTAVVSHTTTTTTITTHLTVLPMTLHCHRPTEQDMTTNNVCVLPTPKPQQLGTPVCNYCHIGTLHDVTPTSKSLTRFISLLSLSPKRSESPRFTCRRKNTLV